jgi:hypothetical protein
LIAMSDIPIPQMTTMAGRKALHFHVQDEGADLPCRGLEKKSDVRPSKLPENASFLPTKWGILGQFFLGQGRPPAPGGGFYPAAVVAGLGGATLGASGVDLTFAPRLTKRA